MEDITNTQKRKNAKDSEGAIKRRNVARADRKPEGKIHLIGDREEIDHIYSQLQRVKRFSGEGNAKKVTNKHLLDTILRFFIDKNVDMVADRDVPSMKHFADTSFCSVGDMESSEQ